MIVYLGVWIGSQLQQSLDHPPASFDGRSMQGSFSFPILFGYLLHQSVDGGGFGQILVLETRSPTIDRQIFSIDHSLSEIDGIDLNTRSYLSPKITNMPLAMLCLPFEGN